MVSNKLTQLFFAICAVVMLAGCTEDAITDPDKLCAREGAGIAARISAGLSAPIDLCVANDSVTTTFTAAPDGRYELLATGTTDGITITIEISFYLQSNQPQQLALTTDASRALADRTTALFLYRESDAGSYDYSTRALTGALNLTVGDQSVAAGTFNNLQIELEDTSSATPAGSRLITEGFLNVTPD